MAYCVVCHGLDCPLIQSCPFPDSLTFQALNSLQVQRRIILSGTPIQVYIYIYIYFPFFFFNTGSTALRRSFYW